jgi:hypothetical protein
MLLALPRKLPVPVTACSARKYADRAELVFPAGLIPFLLEERGPLWQDLINAAKELSPTSREQAALVLMIARLANCPACNTNTFRATRGCVFCSRQALKRFHGTDEDLIQLYRSSELEVNKFLHQR